MMSSDEEKGPEGHLLSPMRSDGSAAGASSSPAQLTSPQPGQAAAARKHQAIELTHVQPRIAQSTVASAEPLHAQQEDALSEDEEEQIRMEAQVGMLLTAARSAHTRDTLQRARAATTSMCCTLGRLAATVAPHGAAGTVVGVRAAGVASTPMRMRQR